MNCNHRPGAPVDPREISRRWFLQECGVGLGAIALSQLLDSTLQGAPANPLAVREPHFAPRRTRLAGQRIPAAGPSNTTSWPARTAKTSSPPTGHRRVVAARRAETPTPNLQ